MQESHPLNEYGSRLLSTGALYLRRTEVVRQKRGQESVYIWGRRERSTQSTAGRPPSTMNAKVSTAPQHYSVPNVVLKRLRPMMEELLNNIVGRQDVRLTRLRYFCYSLSPNT